MKKYVYLIKCENSDNYKIGISKNPTKRLKQLQVGHPYPLELISQYLTENYSRVETSMRNRYPHLKKEGEWLAFSLTEEVEFLECCQQIDKSIKSLKASGNPFI